MYEGSNQPQEHAPRLQSSPVLPRSTWIGVSVQKRLEYLKTVWIGTELHSPILSAIQSTHEFVSASGISRGVLVVCESGGGKTALCRQLELLYPDIELPDRTITQLVQMTLPNSMRDSTLARQLARGLGDPAWDVFKGKDTFDRAVQQIWKNGVKFILVDNFQDIPERRDTGQVRVVGNWFRNLLDAIAVTFVALGTKEAKKVRLANDQVRRRIPTVKTIPYFQKNTRQQLAMWLSLLKELDTRLPLAEESGLASPFLATRLFFASNGIMDYLMRLLAVAIFRCVSRKVEKLNMQDLLEAYEEIAGDVEPSGNPFSTTFAGRTLDGVDELFYMMEDAQHQNAKKKITGNGGAESAGAH